MIVVEEKEIRRGAAIDRYIREERMTSAFGLIIGEISS